MATTLVSGANRGIGLEFCRQAKKRGDTVIAVCRKPSGELEALGVRVERGVDVSKPGDVLTLADRLNGEAIDILINNAGVMLRSELENIDDAEIESIRQEFEVNSLGPLLMTRALLPNLSKGSKVAIITSRMGSIGDNTSGGYYGYRMSKAAVNIAGVSLAVDLKSRGIAVAILHPGYVRTDMTGGGGDVDPDESVGGRLKRIDELTLETSGSFRHANGETLPW